MIYSPASIYYGAAISGWPSNFSAVTQFESDAGKAVSLIQWYQMWGSTTGLQTFQPTWMNAVRNHGSIPIVTWEPWVPGAGVNQPQYSLRNIANGQFDAYIKAWADASRAWGHPYFLRFAHEMNGTWYPWSEQENGNSPGDYVAAWRHVHDIFVREGATNVSWVWCVNILYPQGESIPQLYPGNSYVDWVGIDGYNFGTTNGQTWWKFASMLQPTYNALTQLTSKPLMINETASAEQGGNKAAWITDAYATQIPYTFPRIRGIVWFNYDKEADWRIESSPSAQSAFAKAVASPIYASNTFARLYTSPIPPL